MKRFNMVFVFCFITMVLFASGMREQPNAPIRGSLIVGETDQIVTCANADGTFVEVEKYPKRVIVNYTSLVPLWYQAGGAAIGMPETKNLDELPEAARAIEFTGHTASPNIEKILMLEPDLVILASNMERQLALKDILDASGIDVLVLAYETYLDYVGILELFYKLNGSSIFADPVVNGTVESIEKTITKAHAKPAVSFLSLFSSARSVQAETNNTHTARIAALLGGLNITKDVAIAPGQTRIAFSLERVHMEDPDVIFVTTMGGSEAIREKMRTDFMESDAWKGLRAVKNGRIHFLPNDLFLYKPNDRFPEAFELLYSLMHTGD